MRRTTPEDERKSESKHAGLEIPDGSEEKASAEHCFSKTVSGSFRHNKLNNRLIHLSSALSLV